MKDIDFNNYDVLNLYVKGSKTKTIINSYGVFGWKLHKSVSNKSYSNIMDLTFVRPHYIKNKDRLQLLQVSMGVIMNKMGRLEKFKFSKSIAFCLTCAILSLLFLGAGVLMLLTNKIISLRIVSIILCVLGVFLMIFPFVVAPRIIYNEKNKFNKSIKDLKDNINIIFTEAKALRGVDNGGK